MTNLEMASRDELVQELMRRSNLVALYAEYEDETGPHWCFWPSGDILRMIGICHTRILPHLAGMVYLADGSARPPPVEDGES